MPRSITDEAIVLRTFNVGETDRFCMLLTKEHGRITARANGARRLLSSRGRGLLPLHRITVTWEQRSFGGSVTAVECIDANTSAWSDPDTFSCATQGIELLLKFTEDGLAITDVYDLTANFLRACNQPHPPSVLYVYALKLMKLLGYLPTSGALPNRKPSPAFMALIERLDDIELAHIPSFSPELLNDIVKFIQGLLGAELGIALKSPAVRAAISSGVTPICQVNCRAS